MEIQLSALPQKEIWRYLGCGDQADAATCALAEDCSRQLLSALRPRALWQVLEASPGEDGVFLPESGLLLPGRDLARHLSGCSKAVLMAVTLGAAADALIRRCQVEDLARGVVMDSCATAAVEEACDRVEDQILSALPGQYFTSRFSPGYGDLPLELQTPLLELLDAPRRMGLCATRENILTPRKSVTALMGISDLPLHRGRRSCDCCPMKNTCRFRRKEEHCGL